MRLLEGLPSLRHVRFKLLRQALELAQKETFRVCHISIQSNHIHCIVEAEDKVALAHGMQGFAVRMARRINRVLGRRGRVFAERYHARALRSPRDVRNTLVYVLNNARKHRRCRLAPSGLDPWSTARWFDGWKALLPDDSPSPVATPRTWLLCVGWQRYGLLDLEELPSEP